MPKIQKNFRLSEETIERLKEIAKYRSIANKKEYLFFRVTEWTATEVLESLINEEYFDIVQEKSRK
jgi:hypothetical protein